MLLGGGGYTVKVCAPSTSSLRMGKKADDLRSDSQNVARTWANETAIVLGEELDEDMPFNE